MKKNNSITIDYSDFSKQDLTFKYSDMSLSDFLNMSYTKVKKEVEPVSEKELFKNVFGDLKKVKTEIH